MIFLEGLSKYLRVDRCYFKSDLHSWMITVIIRKLNKQHQRLVVSKFENVRKLFCAFVEVVIFLLT